MMPNLFRSRIALALLVAAAFAAHAARGQSTLPARYADSTFWRLMHEFSEANGQFRSDNLLSNETSFQWVVPTLQKMTRPDGVYLGVAPEQNFTFIAALRPKVAFIQRSYLATDENYGVIKDMHERNVIISFTGDFAGPVALRAFGKYARDDKAVVQAIYVSNVEQYLWQDPNNPRLYEGRIRSYGDVFTFCTLRSEPVQISQPCR